MRRMAERFFCRWCEQLIILTNTISFIGIWSQRTSSSKQKTLYLPCRWLISGWPKNMMNQWKNWRPKQELYFLNVYYLFLGILCIAWGPQWIIRPSMWHLVIRGDTLCDSMWLPTFLRRYWERNLVWSLKSTVLIWWFWKY
jgi:hypothetical protein